MVGRGLHGAPYYHAREIIWQLIVQFDYFDGWAAEHGVDLFAMPVWRLLNLVMRLLYEGKDEKGRDEVDRILTPKVSVRTSRGLPVWVDDPDDWDVADPSALAPFIGRQNPASAP
jgi:hypothetical protein